MPLRTQRSRFLLLPQRIEVCVRTVGELSTVASLSRLQQIADFITQVTTDAGLDEDAAFAVQLAVDEACSNVIAHAYAGRDPGPIYLTCMIDKRNLIILVRDRGQPFSPDDVPEPTVSGDLDNRMIGGLGIHFMRKLMDVVNFDFDPVNGNLLTMVKANVVPAHIAP